MPPTPQRFRTTCATLAVALVLSTSGAFAQQRVDGAIQKNGLFGQTSAPDEFQVLHDSEFKGARKVAISVFNVAFPSENHFTATTTGRSFLGRMTSSAQASLATTMTGVDAATQQRIADRAYALFVEQLTAAGYEVVDPATLATLAPEFATWSSVANFTQGRYGAYVAPTGQSLRWMPGDQSNRENAGVFSVQIASMGRQLDTPQAFSRAPYVAHDGGLGVVAVTLVIDYGVYTNSGEGNKLGGSAKVGFKPGVTVAAGNHADRASYLTYWGPNSGGFPAYAHVQKPIVSQRPFWSAVGEDGAVDRALVAEPAAFEAAADEVVGIAVPKLVGIMAAAR